LRGEWGKTSFEEAGKGERKMVRILSGKLKLKLKFESMQMERLDDGGKTGL
jgi:hypothetical protein